MYACTFQPGKRVFFLGGVFNYKRKMYSGCISGISKLFDAFSHTQISRFTQLSVHVGWKENNPDLKIILVQNFNSLIWQTRWGNRCGSLFPLLLNTSECGLYLGFEYTRLYIWGVLITTNTTCTLSSAWKMCVCVWERESVFRALLPTCKGYRFVGGGPKTDEFLTKMNQ